MICETTAVPTTLSDLVQLAVDDARRLDRDRYTPVHRSWHEPRRNGVCEVCLAGAVIAGTLQAEPTLQIIHPDDVQSERWRNAVEALESARLGSWEDAYRFFHGTAPDEKTREGLAAIPRTVHAYFRGWDGFERLLNEVEDAARELRRLRT